MIFVLLGIAILISSFVIALISLLREQQAAGQNPKKVIEEDKVPVKEAKISPKQSEVNLNLPSHQEPHTEEPRSNLIDDRFPWDEPAKRSSPVEEKDEAVWEPKEKTIEETADETVSGGQKLTGKFFVSGLDARRKSQKESVSK